jgi:glycosyltransferase involved in cell wall biosynthesis
VPAVHQFVPTFAARSAIGHHVREAARTLRDMGLSSEIYVGGASGAVRGEVRDWRTFAEAADGDPTWLLYQLSTGSEMAAYLAGRPEPKLVNYHNITPVRFVRPWEPWLAAELDEARRQLGELAARTELGIADSGYNESELVAAGYRRTAVAPVLIDLEAMGEGGDAATDRRLAAAKAGGGVDWLFVGRVSPNKCQHQVIKAFAWYRRVYDRRARLWLVGGSSSSVYWAALERFVGALGLGGAVTLTGSVPQRVLASHYRHADVLVCLSEHEGFCVPLVEAMWHRVPVVALGSTAVPETVGGAGVVLPFRAGRQPAPAVVAAAVHRVVGEGALRDALVACGERRVAQFSLEHTRRRFAECLRGLEARP